MAWLGCFFLLTPLLFSSAKSRGPPLGFYQLKGVPLEFMEGGGFYKPQTSASILEATHPTSPRTKAEDRPPYCGKYFHLKRVNLHQSVKVRKYIILIPNIYSTQCIYALSKENVLYGE